MGAAGGLFFAAAETGGVIGPTLTGLMADATGSFDAPLLTLTGVCTLCGVLVILLDGSVKRQLRARPLS
jgi:cyanate permease